MALFIPHQCPQCFESLTLIQPQHKGGAFKGPARGQCLNCMDEQEYDLTVPVNRKDLIHAIEVVTPKEDVRLTASIGRNRPQADEIKFLGPQLLNHSVIDSKREQSER